MCTELWTNQRHVQKLFSLALTGIFLLSAGNAYAVNIDSPIHPLKSPVSGFKTSEYYDLHLASMHMEKKNYAQALPFLEAAREKAPTNIITLYDLGSCYMELGKAEHSATKQAALLTKAEETFLRIKSLNADYAVTYFKLGKIAMLQNKMDKAEAYYLDGLKVEPTNAGFIFNLAGLYDQADNVDKAIQFYKLAIEADKDFTFAYNNLGLLYEKTHQPKMAEDAYKAALKNDPKYEYARLNLGNLYAEQGRLAESEGLYQEVLTSNPTNPWAYLYLGNVYLRENKFEEAAKAYQASARHNPTYPVTYYLMAVSLGKMNRVDDALTASMIYLSLAPNGDYAREAREMVMSLRSQQSATLRLAPKGTLLLNNQSK